MEEETTQETNKESLSLNQRIERLERRQEMILGVLDNILKLIKEKNEKTGTEGNK